MNTGLHTLGRTRAQLQRRAAGLQILRGGTRCPCTGGVRSDAALTAPALPWSQVCALLLTVAAATVVVSACGGSGTTPTPAPQPVNPYPENRVCSIGVPNPQLKAAGGAVFTNAGQTATNGQSLGCYFDAAGAGSYVNGAAQLLMPTSSVQDPYTPSAAIRIYDSYTSNQIGDAGLNFLALNPAYPGYWEKDISISYLAGKFNDDPDTRYPWRLRDSVNAYFSGLQSQYTGAAGWSILIGVRDDLHSQGVLGPNALVTDQPATWYYQGGASPDGVNYQWSVDGVVDPNSNTPSYSPAPFSTAGTHWLTVTITRNGDGSTVTFRSGVSVTDRSACPTCMQ